MGDKAGDLCDLMRDILTTARLDDKARFSQMVAETKAGMESSELLSQGMSMSHHKVPTSLEDFAEFVTFATVLSTLWTSHKLCF